MLTRYLLQLLVLISIAHAHILSVQIYAKPLSSKPITLGSLHYDKNTTHASFAQSDLAIDDGHYCIGTTDLPNLECFTYTKLSESTFGTKLLLVHLNANKNIAHLSMSTAPVSKNTSESSIQVAVSKANYDPKPIKNTKAEKAQTNPEATEEEAPRSWIQKNWMYVVPPLLIMFVLLGEDKK